MTVPKKNVGAYVFLHGPGRQRAVQTSPGDPSGSSSRMPILIVVMVHGLHVILAAVPHGVECDCKSYSFCGIGVCIR